MKVKLFVKYEPLLRIGRRHLDLESEINAWLGENRAIKVISIKQSASGGSLNPSVFLISVWYEAAA